MNDAEFQLMERLEDAHWWFVGKRLLLRALLGEREPHGRLLDLGCGLGGVLRDFQAAARCFGADRSPLALRMCRERSGALLARADLLAPPFRAGSFDLVVALDVIEHLDDDAAALREMARALRPGGHLLLHVPAFGVLWSDKDDINQHRRRYRRPLLLRRVREAGLEPVSSGYLNAALFPVGLVRSLWQRVHRPEPEATSMFLDRLYYPSGIVNRAMTSLLSAESRLMRWLPFGMSLLCLARKPSPAAGK